MHIRLSNDVRSSSRPIRFVLSANQMKRIRRFECRPFKKDELPLYARAVCPFSVFPFLCPFLCPFRGPIRSRMPFSVTNHSASQRIFSLNRAKYMKKVSTTPVSVNYPLQVSNTPHKCHLPPHKYQLPHPCTRLVSLLFMTI